MTPEERAGLLHETISRAGGDLYDEIWYDQVWQNGPALKLIADAIRAAELAALEWASEMTGTSRHDLIGEWQKQDSLPPVP